MYVALDQDKKRISIENAVPGKIYYCPICGQQVIIKAADSLAVKKHFAHKKGSDCDDFKRDMSEWHYNWQLQFPLEYREVPLEKNGIKHRADILINNTVIEFQHSPISAEEIRRRNEFYQSCGCKMVWVFDADNQIKNEFNDSIDPMRCRPDDLCWKRPKKQFINSMNSQVTVFLQYKTETCSKQYQGVKFDIMLLLTELGSKYFTFHDTKPQYILPANFLKEYGGNTYADTFSISEIIKNNGKHVKPLGESTKERLIEERAALEKKEEEEKAAKLKQQQEEAEIERQEYFKRTEPYRNAYEDGCFALNQILCYKSHDIVFVKNVYSKKIYQVVVNNGYKGEYELYEVKPTNICVRLSGNLKDELEEQSIFAIWRLMDF